MKNRLVSDIKKRGGLPEINFRLNLDSRQVIFIPLKSLSKIVFLFLILFSFVFGSVSAPSGGVFAAQNDEERKALESQLAEIESQIADYESRIEGYRAQGKNLQDEINRLEAQIAKLNLQIKAINLSLEKLDKEIQNTKNQISQTESEIDLYKEGLGNSIQSLYEKDGEGLVEIILKNPQLSDFFGDLNNLLAVQDNLRITLQKVVEARQRLIDQREVLALERSDAAALKSYQDSQKENIKKAQTEKTTILKDTKGKESEYQKLVTEKKKTAAEIRKQIFQLLGGGELEFEEAYRLASLAEAATGVRSALILAVLDRESALGKNVGRCDYKTAMHPTRDIPVFLKIIKELNLEKDLGAGIVKVSCANSDGAYGGAMGPAQFIPSTWVLYKDRVADLTGHNPPSPWNNSDAFVATALYLKDSGAAGGSLSKEREAAARYYAGSRWKLYLWTYGERVITQAQQFQDDIDILKS